MQSIVYTAVFCLLTVVVVTIRGRKIVDKQMHFFIIIPSFLETICPPNEVFDECDSACPPSCSDLFYPQEPKFCTLQCISRCTCKPGLYRAKNGQCVPPEECCTRRNEEYTSCGTACPETCTFKPEICTANCVFGCFCKPGFIRRDGSTNSPCIKPNRC